MARGDRVLILGGSGFVGRHLCRHLLAQGAQPIVVSRNPARARQQLTDGVAVVGSLDELDARPGAGARNVRNTSVASHAAGTPSEGSADPSSEEQRIDWVVSLVGESVGEGRWSAARKQALLESRLQSVAQLEAWLARRQQRPRRIIQASAVGFYGNGNEGGWSTPCTEDSPPQDVFVSQLCRQLEAAAAGLQAHTHVPVTIIRLGVVFAADGGIFPMLARPVRLGVGRMGTGRQPLCWIHIDDVVAAIHALGRNELQPGEGHGSSSVRSVKVEAGSPDSENLSPSPSPSPSPGRGSSPSRDGTLAAPAVFNLVAPALTTQGDFVAAVTAVLGRPAPFSVPAWVLRLAMGEQADLVLGGQFVVPAALQQAGFAFRHPGLNSTVAELMAQRGR